MDVATTGSAAATRVPAKLAAPEATRPRRIAWSDAVGLAAFHVLALFALVPWFFSWTGVVLALAGLYVFGTLGVNLCFHRLLTHRGVALPKWLEHAFALLGLCCLQDTPSRWVAIHRRHHEHSDEQPDPHSPLVNFLWGHMGWLMVKNRDLTRLRIFERYAKDILRDPLYAWIERRNNWVWIALLVWLGLFAAGFAFVLLAGGGGADAMRFGLSLAIWGGALRTVFVWHTTWSVNSVSHVWGYRNYTTPDASRNNTLVALLAFGEGWHNNHHADSRSARHGHKWWELDPTWLAIRLLMLLGLARNVALPSPALAAKFPAEPR